MTENMKTISRVRVRFIPVFGITLSFLISIFCMPAGLGG
jgi:hypothetical protein